MVKNTSEMFQTKVIFYLKYNWINLFFFFKKKFYWVSCFKIYFYDDNVNQMSQLTRNQMWKCDQSNYSSNSGSVENNF